MKPGTLPSLRPVFLGSVEPCPASSLLHWSLCDEALRIRAASVYFHGAADPRLAASSQRRRSMSNGWRRGSVAGALCLIAATHWAKPARVESGAVEGVTKDALTIYMGVPFAAPPLGELRWREPQPVVPWKGTRQATSFAPACMQKGVSMPGEKPPATSEDCLYLNIWTPGQGRGRTPARHRLDSRRRLYERIGIDAAVLGRPAGAARRRGCDHCLSTRSARLSGPPGVDRRVGTASPRATMDCSIRSRRSNGSNETSRPSAAIASA